MDVVEDRRVVGECRELEHHSIYNPLDYNMGKGDSAMERLASGRQGAGEKVGGGRGSRGREVRGGGEAAERNLLVVHIHPTKKQKMLLSVAMFRSY